MARRPDGPRKRAPYGKWSDELRDGFLAILGATGNARAAFRLLGHENMFRKRRRDPEFAAAWAAAVAAADARLSAAENAWPETGDAEAAGGPPPRPGEDGGAVPAPGPLHHPPAAGGPPLRPGEDLGGCLRPGRKRAASRPQAVIRRTSTGRAQVSFAREGHFTEEIEADFLARLSATGNFSACARAVGFQPASLFERARRWPAFARACDAAIEAASVRLDYALVAHAHNLLRSGEGETEVMGTVNCPLEEFEQPAFDPVMAMRIIAFIEARRFGRTARGRRKGAPERSYEEARESILKKIEAIERHQALKARESGDGASAAAGAGAGAPGTGGEAGGDGGVAAR